MVSPFRMIQLAVPEGVTRRADGSRTLVIGDIHACHAELMTLLDAVSPTSDDVIVHVGDITDRGPAPRDVYEFFRNTPNALSIRGNRDEKHVRAASGKSPANGARAITQMQFGDNDLYAEFVDFLDTLPLYFELPEALVVHGYFEPGVTLEKQKPDVLMGFEEGEQRLHKRDKWPWHELYADTRPLLVGHRAYPFVEYAQRVYPLDLRCVYGGSLAGLLLPDFLLYVVPARANHWLELAAQFPGYAEA